MASNPMQRKARNSFLLGMLLTLIIAGVVIALLFIQLKNYKEKEQTQMANSVQIHVLKSSVKSGEIITTDMFVTKTIDKNLVPSNAIGTSLILDGYYLQDKEGNDITREYRNSGDSTLYIRRNNSRYELKQEAMGSYYIEVNGIKQYVELNTVPVVAKINMNANTVITTDMIAKSDEKTTDDVRKQEYNMISLQTQLQTGDYVDVRLALPSGLDYIVVSKKQVEIPQISGVDVPNTIWMKLAEEEILIMNNAIYDAYKIPGSKLYVTPYIEAGNQNAATPTYVANKEVSDLIISNPNIINEAKAALVDRYNKNAGTRNDILNPAISSNREEGNSNAVTKTEESISSTLQTRKDYLSSLGGDY